MNDVQLAWLGKRIREVSKDWEPYGKPLGDLEIGKLIRTTYQIAESYPRMMKFVEVLHILSHRVDAVGSCPLRYSRLSWGDGSVIGLGMTEAKKLELKIYPRPANGCGGSAWVANGEAMLAEDWYEVVE